MSQGAQMIDWEFAARVGGRLAGQGPEVSATEAAAVVAELRTDAARSTGLVRDFTGLDAPDGTAPILVVDRSSWVRANTESFGVLLQPVVDKLTEKKGQPSGASLAVGSKVTGAEVGLLLGFMAGKVLGQFDPFHDPHGRLLLVAPNVVKVERELSVDATDFRLWVCLHEETHRVQFTAVPWMRDHLQEQMRRISEVLDPGGLMDGGIERIAKAIRGEGSLMEAIGGPEQQEIVDGITGMMSLLEGHADVVMDGVGPVVIGSVATIRSKFNKRRQGVGVLDRLLRRLLGLDAKMAQYRDGAKFVRSVVGKVGMAEFNAVFAGPENLPTKAEIADPHAWVGRVLG
jgi:coenzyme F420 biosynthesis associated uncharacterized protein